jgi:hypothetical protein
MADIFLSYSRQDVHRIETLVRILEQQNWSVWWDYKIRIGKNFARVIEEEIAKAKCVVVLWSKDSVQSDWVRDEAAEGKSRAILVPVLIDNVSIPMEFRRLQTAALYDWDGEVSHPQVERLLSGIKDILGDTSKQKVEEIKTFLEKIFREDNSEEVKRFEELFGPRTVQSLKELFWRENSRPSDLEFQSLKRVFGQENPHSLDWYKVGLERTRSVARIETLDGRAVGTGFLVRKKDFFPVDDGVLLMTNSVVVSSNQSDQGLLPNQAKINFLGLGNIYEVDKVIWSSPRENLNTTFLTIKGEPLVEPLPIETEPIKMSEPPRVYIVGHPGGRALEISLHDSYLIASNETFLHYRTPTEPGSSGSPIFDEYNWNVIGMHQRKNKNMPRIDGKQGTYQANEGITVLAIKKAIETGI